MAERKRSHDGTRETDEFIDDEATPSQQGRSQGGLERAVGTRGELANAKQGKATTRVTKSDEKGQGDLGGRHGTGEK